ISRLRRSGSRRARSGCGTTASSLAALFDDLARLLEPVLTAAKAQHDKHGDAKQEPHTDNDRSEVVWSGRQRVEGSVHGVEQDDARANREHEVVDPVEFLASLAP